MSQVGNVFMLGFRGTTMPDWMHAFDKEFQLGGYILFDYDCGTKTRGRNITSPEQVKELCGTEMQSKPLVFIDQEGGLVRRLKEELGFKPLPSAKKQGSGDLTVAEKQKLLLDSFQELKQLGVDVNLAPVIDINYNEENPDLGKNERSFGASPEVVAENARLYNEAAKKVKLGLCLKHYPGHGAAKKNPHDDLADISGTVTDVQLNMFHELAGDLNGQMVLVGHGLVREWDEKNPSCMAPHTLGILRKAVPDCMIISDDVQMQGLQKIMDSSEACERGIKAGLDMVIVGNNMMNEEADTAFAFAERLVKLSEKDSDFRNRIAEACHRVEQRKISLRR